MSAQTMGVFGVLIVCIFLAAVASGTETALTSVNRLRVRHLAEDGSQRAATLQRLQQDPNRFLGTVLIVNTFSLIIASAAATLLGLQLVRPLLPPYFGTAGDFLVSICLSLFLLIFAEVTPKTLAVRHADRVALQVAPAVDALAGFLKPVLWFVTVVSRAIIPGKTRIRPFVTEAELMTLLSVSEEQGVIEEEERDMIQGIVEIGDTLVREVMVPRTDVVGVEKGATLDEISQLMQTRGHTRLPVYEKDIDHIVGLVHAKDLLRVYARGQRELKLEPPLLRPINVTPEQKKVDELLHDMRHKKSHMMVVIDEYGGTAGIVTLEDVLEEIVGEIRDEYDWAETEPLTIVSANEALVDGGYSMDELNDRLQLGIVEGEEYDSVGGFINSMLGNIPTQGAEYVAGPHRLTVESMKGQRVVAVRIRTAGQWPHNTLVEAGLTPPDEENVSLGGEPIH